MRRSSEKILTTQIGSLPDFVALDDKAPDHDAQLGAAVAGAIKRQRDVGLDIINEGEFTKHGDWLRFVESRLGGFEPRYDPNTVFNTGKDREVFADFYKYATEHGTLFYRPKESLTRPVPSWACTGPVVYGGTGALKREIEVFKKALGAFPPGDAFLTTTAPSSLEPYRKNEYYKSEEEFVYALADAMRHEYRAITEAGLLVQIDDAWIPALWDRIGIQMGLDAFRKYCEMRVEALNHALAGIPEDKVRYHFCWGSWHGPHVYDLPMKDIVDVMLKVKAQCYLFEAANARHEHEYALWETAKLPAGKIVAPGMVTHSTDVVEHPELVSQRIQRFATLVGKENVIAGCDCGFGRRSHPQIGWAKLKTLVEGAALATKALKYA
ncbi:MAG: cobalamin-independent methionine synthase II family protein [Xanthobacteraceae bacterium]